MNYFGLILTLAMFAPVEAPVPSDIPVVAPVPEPVEIEYTFKKKHLKFAVNYEDPVCLAMISELTKDWTKRINPAVFEKLTPEQKKKATQAMLRYNERIRCLKKCFTFEFIDYLTLPGVNDCPKMKFGRYEPWKKFPRLTDSEQRLELLEWIANEWFYEVKNEQWLKACDESWKQWRETDQYRRRKFIEEALKKNPKIAAANVSNATLNLYLVRIKNPPKNFYGVKLIRIERLGYVAKEQELPRAPRRSACPIEGYEF